jgi:acyl-CoA reductase-like NAD-dependent aldehyde dehydrogenase
MAVLRSYVSGRWTSPADGRPVRDAVTGEEIARVSADGIDLAAALEYGRATGGPALRALTFHQRAALVKAVGTMLREHRSELYGLSARTGATLGDAKFDVDGGIGVFSATPARPAVGANDTFLWGRGRAARPRRPVHRPARAHSAAGVAVRSTPSTSGLGPAGDWPRR